MVSHEGLPVLAPRQKATDLLFHKKTTAILLINYIWELPGAA